MENKLDLVEEDKYEWPDMMKEFYFPFKKHVDELMSSLESYKGSLDEPTDKICDLCGKPMVKKLGRFGYFLACSGDTHGDVWHFHHSGNTVWSAAMHKKHTGRQDS